MAVEGDLDGDGVVGASDIAILLKATGVPIDRYSHESIETLKDIVARWNLLRELATLRAHFGSLDKVGRVVKVLGMVNSGPAFLEHPQVINGCSELFAEVFGPEHGIGARSAVGMGSLPGNIPVEVECIFEVA